jgi:cytochrome c553
MKSFSLKLLTVLFVAVSGACSPSEPSVPQGTLAPGDVTHGAELFTQAINGAPACNTCHTTDETKLVGPGLGGYAERAASRVEGESAEAYTQESINTPASFIVPDFPNAMFNGYASKLSPQDMADLTAYLLTL